MNSVIENDNSVNDILLSTKQGIVTREDIKRAIAEYTELLPVPEYLFTKIQTFDGLIRYIYDRILKNIIPGNNRHDYRLLDNIFYSVYIPLCNMYGFVPNIVMFCNMVNIDNDIIYRINNSMFSDIDNTIVNDDSNSNGVNNNYSSIRSITKAWRDTCEAALSGQVANHSSIGSMFLLKAKYGYSENNTLTIQSDQTAPRIDEKQISALASGSLPELPDNMP